MDTNMIYIVFSDNNGFGTIPLCAFESISDAEEYMEKYGGNYIESVTFHRKELKP